MAMFNNTKGLSFFDFCQILRYYSQGRGDMQLRNLGVDHERTFDCAFHPALQLLGKSDVIMAVSDFYRCCNTFHVMQLPRYRKYLDIPQDI